MVRPMPKQQLAIHSEILLLCERREIAQFVQAYMQHLQKQKVTLPRGQFLLFRSMEQLSVLAQRLPLIPGSERVRRIIVFADAGNNLEERRELLDVVRGSAYFSKVLYCTHYFFPGRMQGKRWRQGYLEDLLLPTLRAETAACGELLNLLNVGREYLLSVDSYRGYKLNNSSRNLLHTYFAATEKYAGLNVGEAAWLGAFDLENKNFACLKQCLEKAGR